MDEGEGVICGLEQMVRIECNSENFGHIAYHCRNSRTKGELVMKTMETM